MKFPPALRRLLIAVRGRTEAYVRRAALPNVPAVRTCSTVDRRIVPSEVAPPSIGGEALRNRWFILAVLFVVRLTMAFQFQSVAAVAPLLGSEFGVSLADIGILIGLYFTPG